MAKLDVFSLLPAEETPERRELTDPAQPGKMLPLTLRRAGFPELAYAQDLGRSLTEMYVTGKDGKPPVPWPPPGGRQKPILMSEALCRDVAMVRAMECPADPEELYEAPELLIIADCMPQAWAELLNWVVGLNSGVKEQIQEGNDSAACEGTSSAPRSQTDAPTPEYTSTSVPPSIESWNSCVEEIKQNWDFLNCRPRSSMIM